MTLQLGKSLTSSTDLIGSWAEDGEAGRFLKALFLSAQKGHSALARNREASALGQGNLPHIWEKKAYFLPCFDSAAGPARSILDYHLSSDLE